MKKKLKAGVVHEVPQDIENVLTGNEHILAV